MQAILLKGGICECIKRDISAAVVKEVGKQKYDMRHIIFAKKLSLSGYPPLTS